MRIFLTKHATERMVQRGVELWQVEETLLVPEVIRGLDDGTTLVAKRINGDTLKVFVKGRYLVGAKAIIVTVAWKGR